MPNSKKSTKGRKSKSKKAHKNKGLSKVEQKQVLSLIDGKAETKYNNIELNSYLTWNKDSSQVDGNNNRALVDVTQTITNGDTYLNRDGDKIQMMYYQIRMRIHPEIKWHNLQVGYTSMAQNVFQKIKYINCHLLRIDRTSAITAGEIDQCIRRPMENWMDTRQDVSREHRKEFQIVKSFRIPVDYKNVVNLDTTTTPQEFVIGNIPQLSYVNQTCKLDRKMIFNAASNDKPVKYSYQLFFTWGNYLRSSYEDLTFPTIDYWGSWVFKDI
jgi:hypothetical protein